MKRVLLLNAALIVGCAMLPLSLAPAHVHYIVETDWEGVPLVGGERVFETDLGYVVGVSAFRIHTTSMELIPCENLSSAWGPLPTRAFAHGGAYEHDVTVVEPEVDDDLMIEQALNRGDTLAEGAAYCELFTTHRSDTEAATREVIESIASLEGWIRAPGSEDDVPFSAAHRLGLTGLSTLPIGVSNDALLPDEAEVVVTRFPARAFDGLELESMPELDIVYEVSQALLRTREVRWSIGPAI